MNTSKGFRWLKPAQGMRFAAIISTSLRAINCVMSESQMRWCWLLCSLINNQLLTDARTPWITSCAWLLALHVLDGEVKKWFFNNSSTVNTSQKRKMNIHKKSMEMWRASNHNAKKKYSCRHPLTREPWQWMNGCSKQRIGNERSERRRKKLERNFCKLKN